MSYIQASTSYSIAISTFRTSCDRLLVSAFAGFSTVELRLQADVCKGVSGLGKEMNKIMAWNTEMTASAKTLQNNLFVTKTKLEKEMSELLAPKRDLSIYQTYNLPVPGKGSHLNRPSVSNEHSTPSTRKRNISISISG